MDSLIFKYVYNLLRISLLKARFILMERIYIIAQDKPIHLCPPLLLMAMLCSHLVDIGFHFLVEGLSKNGSAQTVYDLTSDRKTPGYGFQLDKDATALTESWAALEEVSNNHLMLGHLMQWFFDAAGGIKQEDTSVAYKNFVIRPEPILGLDKGNVYFNSPYGRIYSEWDHQYSFHVFTIQVPVNTTATVCLPTPPNKTILESNTPLSMHREIKALGYIDGRQVFKLGSGKYKFIIR
jgi:hypothetical protein